VLFGKDHATWRAVRLNMIQNGVQYDLAFLRPLSWLESTGEVVGGSSHMELHEMGLNGPARVVGIDPCPIIEPDNGSGRNVVTGTMAHPGANIVYLDITGLDEPLGVTDTHPIWSETRQDFVVAGQLEIGEQFRTVTGQSATLTRSHPHRGPPEMVFNLEVDGQHVYHVAASGLLVHNAGCVPTIPAYIDGTTIAPIQGQMTTTTEGIWNQIGSMLAEKQSRHVGTISRSREEAEALARHIAEQNGISNPTLRLDASDARGFWPHFHIEEMPMNLHFWWPQ
jgi:hypothetical protein